MAPELVDQGPLEHVAHAALGHGVADVEGIGRDLVGRRFLLDEQVADLGAVAVDDDQLVALADDGDHEPGGLFGVLDLLFLSAALLFGEKGVPAEGDQGEASFSGGHRFVGVRSEFRQDVLERRRADFLEVVADREHRLAGFDQPVEVDRRGADDQVAVDLLDRRGQLGDLFFAVAHGRQDLLQVGVFVEGRGDRLDRERPRIDDLGRAVLLGGDDAGAVGHAAVGDGRAVLDDEDALAPDLFAVLDAGRGVGLDDDGGRVDFLDVFHDLVHARPAGRCPSC